MEKEIKEIQGCNKEIEYNFGTIFGTSETTKTKCGFYCDGKKQFCDKCLNKLKK